MNATKLKPVPRRELDIVIGYLQGTITWKKVGEMTKVRHVMQWIGSRALRAIVNSQRIKITQD